MQDMEEVYNQYFKTVYKYLFCLTQNSDLAEELTQETFLRAVENIHQFRGDSSISTWLCEIAKHLWFDYLKKNKRIKNEGEIETLKELPTYFEIEEEMLYAEEKMALYRKMQKLDPKTREVIYLRITGEFGFKEIAQILGKTENWARVTFYRGKEKLKEVGEE